MLLVYDARSKKVFSINAEGTAPRLATIDWYKKNQGGKIPVNEGLLSATVPGAVDAWYTLLERWGTMTFAQVLAPAIEIAEQGFPIGERLARGIAATKKLHNHPTSVRLYFPGGEAPRPGEIFRNPDAARTLRRLVEAERESAARGRREALRAARDRFYKGDIARAMARFSEENGGLFRYEDFAAYSAKVEEPVSIDYERHEGSGFVAPFWEQPLRHWAGMFEAGVRANLVASRLAVPLMLPNRRGLIVHTTAWDRDKYLGDLDFIRVPYEGLLAREYARERRKLIDAARASLELRPGVPEKFMKDMPELDRPMDVDLTGRGDHFGDTSYIAVVDRDRNMITFTPSLHSGFGTGVVMGDLGFAFNCRGDYYSLVQGQANALQPGKRPRSTLQGTLVLKDGQPAMVAGSPGGDDQCMRTLQTFLNMVEFGMNVQQAIEAPRWSTRSFPSSPFPHTMYPGDLTVESRVPESVRQALAARGHKVHMSGPWSLGSNAAIVIDPKTGVLAAGADPRVDAYALAW